MKQFKRRFSRFVCCVFAIVLFVCTHSNEAFSTLTSTVSAETTKIVPGDVDGSGDVEILDAVLLAKAIAGVYSLTNPLPADVNSNGTVEAGDLVWLLKILSGITLQELIDAERPATTTEPPVTTTTPDTTVTTGPKETTKPFTNTTTRRDVLSSWDASVIPQDVYDKLVGTANSYGIKDYYMIGVAAKYYKYVGDSTCVIYPQNKGFFQYYELENDYGTWFLTSDARFRKYYPEIANRKFETDSTFVVWRAVDDDFVSANPMFAEGNCYIDGHDGTKLLVLGYQTELNVYDWLLQIRDEQFCLPGGITNDP